MTINNARTSIIGGYTTVTNATSTPWTLDILQYAYDPLRNMNGFAAGTINPVSMNYAPKRSIIQMVLGIKLPYKYPLQYYQELASQQMREYPPSWQQLNYQGNSILSGAWGGGIGGTIV